MQINFLENGAILATQILDVLIEEYQFALEKYSKIATRETINSLGGIKELNTNELTIKITSAVSLLYIEFGRRAGAKMPPQGSLDDWYAAKGIDPKLDFVIRRAIAKKGIKPTPIGQYVLDASRPRLEAIFNEYMSGEMRKQLEVGIRTIYKRI
jgi:hypothetical protein